MKTLFKTLLLVGVVTFLIAIINPSEGSSNNFKSIKATGDTVKILDTFYTSNCIIIHRIRWATVHTQAFFKSFDTIIVKGNPCVPFMPTSEIGWSKIKDICYMKYCLLYCEKTWANDVAEPFSIRDTIFIPFGDPCVPAITTPPPY